MKGELPVFKRCCFCLPLRYGLLAWGYFKLIADAFLIFLMTFIFIETLRLVNVYANSDHVGDFYAGLIISSIAITLFFTDFIVTIVFIIGGHKKNVQLIRVFYFLSMGMWVATFLLASFTIITTIQAVVRSIQYSSNHYFMLNQTLMASCFYFVVLVVQTYFLLLLRSEIIKLRNNGEFRFVNNAVEAECTMRCEEVVVATETAKSDDLRDPETNLQAPQKTDVYRPLS
ncbi:hypothetical protein PYW08_011587 [Mythimna loreyi]|uniref:Uncharacterized protein n=1 Tax=Mythimna loreyi TaxID=667449 RepID=A0ACC2QKY3_9NEOP|nr:hypothetical protein PYW08_011587 [Mythimna loreyi]